MAINLGTDVVAAGNGVHVDESGSMDLHWEAGWMPQAHRSPFSMPLVHRL